MGNRSGVCGGTAAQHCVDECTRMQFEMDRSGDADEPECAPAGAVFSETLTGLSTLDQEALHFAGTSNISAIRWLLTMGTSLNAQDRNNTTLLHTACRSGCCSIIQELLNLGLPLDAVDTAGWTPLHIAAMMGRYEVVVLLLQASASVGLKNNRGKTPLMLCSDPATKQLLHEFNTMDEPARGAISLSGLHQNVRALSDRGGVDDVSCEPFFVPRPPLFCDDSSDQPEFAYLGLELFRKSSGHGVAFMVACGLVRDHPKELSGYLLQSRVDAAQLGEFLGEDFSLAQTIRLAYIHSVDLTGTGVVGALSKAFTHIFAPPDLRKIDRLTQGIAYLWWRTHMEISWGEDGSGEDPNDDWLGGLQGSLNGDVVPLDTFEASGAQLFNSIVSAESLRRLMFSTVMLSWSLYFQHETFPYVPKQQQMSFSDWVELNRGLQADGVNVPVHVQSSIYESVAGGQAFRLLPKVAGALGAKDNERLSTCTLKEEENNAMARLDREFLVSSWASIPRGGLECQEGYMTGFGAASSRFVSESAGAAGVHLPGSDQPSNQQNELVWLKLQFVIVLFLASSPNDAPYAFLRLRDAMVRDASREARSLVLVGKQREASAPAPEQDTVTWECAAKKEFWSPFPDAVQEKLPICFLLADGRFQPFQALWLELQFRSDEDFDLWHRRLLASCVAPRKPNGTAGPASMTKPLGLQHKTVVRPRQPTPVDAQDEAALDVPTEGREWDASGIPSELARGLDDCFEERICAS
mmetsp:Transcript_21960/g.61402  ORF Transcript_21960/g.61402 Transcript_21960/m.61402 type:complete len:751 (-) Transcript_21960:89-2341(-)